MPEPGTYVRVTIISTSEALVPWQDSVNILGYEAKVETIARHVSDSHEITGLAHWSVVVDPSIVVLVKGLDVIPSSSFTRFKAAPWKSGAVGVEARRLGVVRKGRGGCGVALC